VLLVDQFKVQHSEIFTRNNFWDIKGLGSAGTKYTRTMPNP